MAAKSYADRVREAQQAQAQENNTRKGDPRELVPGMGSLRVRLLPPRDLNSTDPASISLDPNDLFYYTHSFHFLPSSFDDLATGSKKGKFYYSKKNLTDKNGSIQRNPIDKLVDSWFEEYKATKNETLRNLASRLKRRRRYVFPVILLDEPDPTKKLKLIIDTTKDGLLIKQLCTIQGLPFYKDIEDNWLDADTLKVYAGKKYLDLLDYDNGYDVTIIKTKTGGNDWDISYADTFVEETTGPRPLNDVERSLLGNRFDIRSYIEYKENYEEVYRDIVAVVGEDAFTTAPAKEAPAVVSNSKPAPAPASKPAPTATPAISKPQVSVTEEADEESPGLDEILGELEADA